MNCPACGKIMNEFEKVYHCTKCGTEVSKKEALLHKISSMGRKDDPGKARWDLLPWKQVKSVVDVLTFGARKYADNNWQAVESPRERYFAAVMRHIEAWWGGEKNDFESGLHHLAHAACCLIFMMWFDEQS